LTWWSRLVRRRKLEAQLDAELKDHVERQVADYVRAGVTEPEARRRAQAAFGGLDQAKEYCRDARGTRWLDDMVQDLAYGLRVLRRSPTFTVVAVLSLALGIGANTAIFTLVNGLLLRSLPVREPERIVMLQHGSFTHPIWEQIRDRQTELFDRALAWNHQRFDLAQGGAAEPIDGIMVSGSFFGVLGVPAVLGRPLAPTDDDPRTAVDGPVAVISHSFWQRRFGGAADVVGHALSLDRVPFTIVGVMAPEFTGPTAGRTFDVATPLTAMDLVSPRENESWLTGRSTWWLDIAARLKPGQSLEQATAALRAVQPQIREATLPQRWRADDLKRYLAEGFTFVPAATGSSDFRNRYERPLLVLMAVVGLVLLVACANIANLLLARADGRRHELTVRLAIGASRLRIARQLLTESLLLATLGAALGLAFAHWGSRLLVHQLETGDERVFVHLVLDWRVLAFTAVVAVATALLFGTAPAFRAGRVEPQAALREQGRTFSGERRRGLGSPLVVAQVALSLVIVVCATLFLRTFTTLAARDLGFDRDRVLLVSLDVRRTAPKAEQMVALVERMVEAVSAVPGVERAAASTLTPVSHMRWNDTFELPDSSGSELSERERTIWVNAVTPGHFATYGTPLLAGRDVERTDRLGAPGVVVVNQAFARKYTNGQSPLGHVVREIERPDHKPRSYTVVGMVADSVYDAPREEMPPTLYLAMAQAVPDLPPDVNINVRAQAGSSTLLIRGVAAAIAQVDRQASLRFRPLAAQVASDLVRERLLAMLSVFFGVLALVVAGIGLYGMTSYTVGRRRTEIGIRMALGADAAGVVRLVLRRVATLIGLGVGIGVLMSLWASRFVGSLLYGVEPRDPVSVFAAAVVLTAIGALAAWLPARQAARVDPASVLREG
jgi:putative ABC transport system permease protein